MIIDRDKYEEREMKISMGKLNLLSIPFAIVVFIPLYLLYYWIWNVSVMDESTGYVILLGILIGMVLHELIHGVVAAKYADKGWGSVSFGVMWKYLAPYCHCKEPLMVNHYRAVILMPSIVAFLFMIVATLCGLANLVCISAIMLVGGIGDFTICYRLRKEAADVLVYDYPDKVGGAIFVPKMGDDLIAKDDAAQ